MDRLFDTLCTTKPGGMGLSISRTILAAHGGRLWTTPHDNHSATFQFTLPTSEERRDSLFTLAKERASHLPQAGDPLCRGWMRAE
jgi:hypothetical protein